MPQSALRQFTPQSAEPAVRSYNPFNPAFRETMRSGITDLLGGRAMGGTPTQRYRAGMADLLTGAVDFAPGIGDAVGVADTVAIPFRPNQVRSIFADFDPAKRGSANLMAGAAGATVGLSALRNIQRDEEPQPD